MKSLESQTTSHRIKRITAIALVLVLCAVAAVSLAGNNTAANTGKHFTLESATQEVSNDPNRPSLTIKEIAKQVRPSLVGINVETTVSLDDQFGGLGGFGFGYGNGNGFGNGFGNGNGYGQSPQYRQQGAGSGIIISADGYILTNDHVVNGANSMKVVLNDGTEYDATLIGEDQANDVAIIKVDAKGLTPAIMGDSSKVEVGELAVAIGNPLGESNGSVTAGIISAPERTITIEGQDLSLLQTDAAINPGNSGGALINSFGEVIGLVNAKAAALTVEGIGYAIPINNVKPLAEEIVNTGASIKPKTGPMLGITIRNVDAATAKQYGVPEGVYVTDVAAFSAAEKAGVHRGDTILSLGGKDIKTTEELNKVKAELELGVPQKLTVLRDGEKVELTVVLVDPDQPTS